MRSSLTPTNLRAKMKFEECVIYLHPRIIPVWKYEIEKTRGPWSDFSAVCPQPVREGPRLQDGSNVVITSYQMLAERVEEEAMPR